MYFFTRFLHLSGILERKLLYLCYFFHVRIVQPCMKVWNIEKTDYLKTGNTSVVGKPYEGKLHVRFDVAGDGKGSVKG